VCSGRDLAAIELRVWLALREASATRLAKVEQAAQTEAWTAEQARGFGNRDEGAVGVPRPYLLVIGSVEQTRHGVPS
jgi:hypothetical protein